MLAACDVNTDARRLARLVKDLQAREGGEKALASVGYLSALLLHMERTFVDDVAWLAEDKDEKDLSAALEAASVDVAVKTAA